MGNCSCEVCMWFVFCGRNAFMYGDDIIRVQVVRKRRKEFEYGRTDTKMMMASIGPSRRGSLWSKHWFTKTDKLQFNIYPLRSSRMGKRKWLSVNGCTANASYYRSHCGPSATNPQPRTELLQDPLQSRATTFLLQRLQRLLSSGTGRRVGFGRTAVFINREAQFAWTLSTNRSPRLSEHAASHPRQWTQCHIRLPCSPYP